MRALFCVLLLVGACGGGGGGDGDGGTSCEPGDTNPCICVDGRAGAQLCQNGVFGVCLCTGPAIDAAPRPDSQPADAGPADAALDAGPVDAAR